MRKWRTCGDLLNNFNIILLNFYYYYFPTRTKIAIGSSDTPKSGPHWSPDH
jgi:hypothetical protein